MLFAEITRASALVAATSKRNEKVAAFAGVLRGLSPDEVGAAVGFLTGDLRQGRMGVGWRTVMSVGERHHAEVASLTVHDVDATFDELAATTGPGSQARRRVLLESLFDRATPVEADLLRRLMGGELRQGALDAVVADAVAAASDTTKAAVRRAWMLSGDLRVAAAAALAGGADALDAFGLAVGRFVQPMLASTAPDVATAIEATGPASVEWKLDGARVQVHHDGSRITVFTRNGNDVTDRVPNVVAVARSLACAPFVLDGEVIGVDDEGKPDRFQDTMSSLGTDAASPGATPPVRPGAQLTPFFFDALHVGGHDLLDRPLSERRAALSTVAGQWQVPGVVGEHPDDVEGFAADAVARGHEGVMVKALSSVYEAGRRGGSWRKVKPVHTLDLVVLAVERGSGRRTGWLSNLHLGARGADGDFVMVGKTFKGLTDELLRWQTERFEGLAQSDDGHVVTLRPEQVVEIAVDGVQRSTRYPGGVALRFARVRRYRPDKSPTEADTIESVQAMLAG